MNKVEFLIVGQGIAGTTLAYEMLHNNVDFRIISSPQKSKASLVAAGMINPLVFKRLTKSWMVDVLLPEMKSTYQNLENKLGEKLLFEKDLLKPLSAQEAELWRERKNNPAFSNYIKSIKTNSPIEHIYNADSFGLVSGSGYLKLGRFLELSEVLFRRKGLLIDSAFSFKSSNSNTNEFRIDNVVADKIVFCEGFHLKQNPLFSFVKMSPVKGEVLQIYSENLSEDYILNKKVFCSSRWK